MLRLRHIESKVLGLIQTIRLLKLIGLPQFKGFGILAELKNRGSRKGIIRKIQRVLNYSVYRVH